MIDVKQLESIFIKDQKCIINSDLDGLLSGMFLHKFLNWEIVGYSSCSGKKDDQIWIKDKNINLQECVFVDLPVVIKNIRAIDQHFVLVDEEFFKQKNNFDNKLNPNIIRKRFLFKDNDESDYIKKYPFGTVHFIIACLEKLGFVKDDFGLNIGKKIDNFDLADILFRADCVIGNTNLYTHNCLDWCDWLMSVGGNLTKRLFNHVKLYYKTRLITEKFVEEKLNSLGCGRADGDCSNMFHEKDYIKLKGYFDFLSEVFNMESLPIFEFLACNNLVGSRCQVTKYNLDKIKHMLNGGEIFSYAFVTKKTLSVTKLKK